MASYKVLQDIETEDKLLGPLTLRQFIYAGITVLFGYLSFLSINKHAIFLLVIFVPPMAVTGFFAFPWSNNQSTETWALAKIRFMFKPRRRIWDQSGIKDLVTITAPKHAPTAAARNLSPTEVKSRLQALAETIDSRGWSTKDVNVSLYSEPSPVEMNEADSERLVAATALPESVPNLDIHASDDMLDEHNNSTAQNFDKMIGAATQAHRQQVVEAMRVAAAPAPKSSGRKKSPSGQPPAPGYLAFRSQIIAPQADVPGNMPPAKVTAEESILAKELRARRSQPNTIYTHLRTIRPLSAKEVAPKTTARPTPAPQQQKVAKPVKPEVNPVILSLSRNNDRVLSSLASEANEVVINLH